jgi:type I restriction enzyme S subunit
MKSESKQLGSICTIKQGKYLSPDEMSEKPIEGMMVPVIGGNGILGYTSRSSHSRDVPLITCRGSKCGLIQWAKAPVWVSNNAIACDSGGVIGNEYLRYLFSQAKFDDVITGSAQPQITISHLSNKYFPIVPPGEQKLVVDFLRDFDDQITLLRETNATLEAIAQAIFKSWFIDFDPVRAKMEGRQPEGMNAETAAIFPDSFEDSELGAIPKGWRVGCYGDIATLAKGTINPQKYSDQEFYHFSLPAFDDGQLPVRERGEMIKSNKTAFYPGAVLQSKLNPHIPRIWFASDVSKNAICSTEFLPWKATDIACNELIYCLLRSTEFSTNVQSLVNGTSNSHQRIKPDLISELAVIISSGSVVRAFEAMTSPLLSMVKANIEEAVTLAEIRDTLLPRLISGKIRLNEDVEEAEKLKAA